MHGHMSEFGCRHLGLAAAAGAAARGWKPFPLPGAPKRWSRDRQVDVLHIKLEIDLDPHAAPGETCLAGTVTHTVRPVLDGMKVLHLDCAELDVSACMVGGKKAAMCDPADAERITGYVVGGISPLGQRKRLRTVLDETVDLFDTVYVSGGRRGLDIALDPADLARLLDATVAPITA